MKSVAKMSPMEASPLQLKKQHRIRNLQIHVFCQLFLEEVFLKYQATKVKDILDALKIISGLVMSDIVIGPNSNENKNITNFFYKDWSTNIQNFSIKN